MAKEYYRGEKISRKIGQLKYPTPGFTRRVLFLETYLITTFSKIKNQYGQNLNVAPALPTLVQVLKNEHDAVKKFDFIGEGACDLAIRCILARTYSNLEDKILYVLTRKFRPYTQLSKSLIREMQLKTQLQYITLTPNIMLTIFGVLFTFFGATAVEKFVENAVLMIVQNQLNEAKSYEQEEGPLQVLHQLIIVKHGGSIHFSPKQMTYGTLNQWQVTVTAKINQTSALFSHTRTAYSVRKAKIGAYQDILKYFEIYPDHFEQLKLPVTTEEVFVLPIEKVNQSLIESNNTTTTATPPQLNSINSTDSSPDENSNNYHVTLNDEDAIRKLSALLLGNSMDTEMTDDDAHTRKRMRDNEKNKGVDNMFTSTNKTDQEPLKVKTEPVFNSFSLFSTASATTTPQPTNTQTKEKPETTENVTNTEAPFNPFVGAPPAQEVNPRILHYFKNIFKHHRTPILSAIEMPGQSKSTLLSLVLLNGDKIECNGETKQVGSSHNPVFSATVVLKSKEYGNVLIQTDGVATRKKDAERAAYHKLVLYFK